MAISRSTMLTTTQTWFGMIRTTSPTLGRSLQRGQVEKAVLLGEGGDLGLRVLQDQAEAVVRPPESPVSVFEPESRMPARARRG